MTALRSQGNGYNALDSCTPPPAPPPAHMAPPSAPPGTVLGSPPPFQPASPSSPPPIPVVEMHADDGSINSNSYTANAFQTIMPSLLSTFILITTGENYADIMSRPFFCFDVASNEFLSVPWRNVLIMLYWIVLSIVGLVLMVGMFIGVFQDGFIRQRNAQRTQVKLFERVGAIAAFSLLDVRGEGTVTLPEFKAFLEFLEKNEGISFGISHEELFKLLRDTSETSQSTTRRSLGFIPEEGDPTSASPGPPSNTLDLPSFVFNLWFLQLRGVLSTRVEDIDVPHWRRVLIDLYDHPSIPPVASPHLTSLGATWQVRPP